MDWQWLVLLGFGTGVFGVTIGTGGGLLLVPLLLIFTQLEPAYVAGTSLSLVAINSITSSVAYLRRGLVDKRGGVLFGLAAVPGSVIAPFAVESMGGGIYRILFALLLLGLAMQMLRSKLRDSTQVVSRRRAQVGSRRYIEAENGQVFEFEYSELLAAGFNALLGFVSAFFGTGGGYIRTPVLVEAFGFPVRVAVATSVFALAFYATTGAAVHAFLYHVEWYPIFIWTGVGLVVGGQMGAKLAATIQGTWIIRALILLLVVMGVRLLIQGVLGT